MNIKLFIAGTDTEVGKTYVTKHLLLAFQQMGLATLGLKPVASGGNADTEALSQAASIKIKDEAITPFSFIPAIAPHLAAIESNVNLSLDALSEKVRSSLTIPADICLIEGFGGWYAPLNMRETMADFVIEHQLSVILVVGIRLGCINHSLLTYKAMKHDKVPIVGWIANCIDKDMSYSEENIESLKTMLPIPWLGSIQYAEKTELKINLKYIIDLFKDNIVI